MNLAYLQTLCGQLRRDFETDCLIIAGGAIADTLAGREVKDIDVFLRLPEESYERTADGHSRFRKIAKLIADKYEFVTGITFHDASDSGGELVDVADITRADGPPIQLLALWVDPVDDVTEYDVCQRQCFVTPRGLFQTAACARDFANETLTYNAIPRGPASFERSVNRYARLQAKYFDWTFAGFEKHEARLRERSMEVFELLEAYRMWDERDTWNKRENQ